MQPQDGDNNLENADMSPILKEVERKRIRTEKSGVRHDVLTELEYHAFKQLARSWPNVFLRYNGSAVDAPSLHGHLVKNREKEWVIFGNGRFWAVRKTHWTLVGTGHRIR